MGREQSLNTGRSGLPDPVNDRNLRCWATDGGLKIRFTPHLDLSITQGESYGVAGYTFHDVPLEVVEGLRHLQDTCARLQERVWELEQWHDD